MPVELDISMNSDYMHVRSKGIRTRERVVDMARTILGMCDDYKQTKVMVDVRELKGRLGALDSYSVTSVDFPKLTGIHDLQVAIVDDDVSVDSPSFFEKFSQQQSFHLKMFGCVEDAVTWLQEAA